MRNATESRSIDKSSALVVLGRMLIGALLLLALAFFGLPGSPDNISSAKVTPSAQHGDPTKP